ncbi:uncharacterized protein KNAG_0F01280 [Huiozyma naganishii CBS 8797]|uniref:Uncharacterized protein n=1 Tax=Huiozyma naganishii (strain ATCC MYA-139 / BCRC 22969 / CBS 8797 / KCTC 17520 / NBRC 10181 / NCYC 3082 / Yp74L-3) TaxID=1071383 RepID=J7S898_HUIN7|nr:hypothetical protein KNAG_0F01280 [Kazachstania naganishii CBS 8797]CCK70796.1 hypothetical protein KNAG_0F01280 [Kazachstania naganishii CBS 8797]
MVQKSFKLCELQSAFASLSMGPPQRGNNKSRKTKQNKIKKHVLWMHGCTVTQSYTRTPPPRPRPSPLPFGLPSSALLFPKGGDRALRSYSRPLRQPLVYPCRARRHHYQCPDRDGPPIVPRPLSAPLTNPTTVPPGVNPIMSRRTMAPRQSVAPRKQKAAQKRARGTAPAPPPEPAVPSHTHTRTQDRPPENTPQHRGKIGITRRQGGGERERDNAAQYNTRASPSLAVSAAVVHREQRTFILAHPRYTTVLLLLLLLHPQPPQTAVTLKS